MWMSSLVDEFIVYFLSCVYVKENIYPDLCSLVMAGRGVVVALLKQSTYAAGTNDVVSGDLASGGYHFYC